MSLYTLTLERDSKFNPPDNPDFCYGACNLITLLVFTYLAWLTKLIAIKVFRSLMMQWLCSSQWFLTTANSRLIRSCTVILILNILYINLIKPTLALLQWHQESKGLSCLSHHFLHGCKKSNLTFLTSYLQAESAFFHFTISFWITLLLTLGMQSETWMGVKCGEDVLELSRWIPRAQWLTSPPVIVAKTPSCFQKCLTPCSFVLLC